MVKRTFAYALKIILVSLVFVPFTIALLAAVSFGSAITWTHILVIIAVFLTVDIILIITTGRPRRTSRHADPS